VERAGQRQRLGTGPVTDAAAQPSRSILENRKASEHVRPARDAIRFARRTVASIHTAEQDILAASQRAARRQAVKAADAILSARHASNIAAVITKFAGRRAALAQMIDPSARAAAALQLSAEETAELARLALEHAAEKRRLRHTTLATLATAHRPVRRNLRQRQRRQKIGITVQLQALLQRSTAVRSHPRATSRAVRRID
jgi:transposase InsO family protein